MAIKTYKQGHLDGLCGAYSVHNAIRRLLYIRTERDWDDELFKTILRSIPNGAYPDVLWKGLDIDQLFRIAKRTCRWLHERHRIEIVPQRPYREGQFKTARTYLARLDKLIREEFTTVIVGIGWATGSGHWSVYRGMDEQGLRLFDSGDAHRLKFGHLSIDNTRKDCLWPEETITFQLVSIDGEPL